MAALDDVESRVNQCADTILKASNMAYDTVRHFGNMQQVVSTGQAGALALADTLAAAPTGDTAQLRANIGLKNLSLYDDLSSAPIGDRVKFAKDNGIVYADHIERVGLNDGNVAQPYLLSLDGTPVWLVSSTVLSSELSGLTLMSLPFGDEAWKVRQRIGLGNDKEGREALNVPEASNIIRVGMDGGNGYKPFMLGSDGGVKYLTAGNDSVNRVGMEVAGDPKTVYVGYDFGYTKLRTFANTTADGNGFIKAASPILRIGSVETTITDRSFYPAGDGATNEEAIGVTCERTGEGVYLVTGCAGFASEGWTLETPKDENGQPLLWVNNKVLDDGSVVIETYHRTHPNAPSFAQNNIDGKKDGDPIDIPSGRWVDLRLKMPEKEKSAE